MNLLTIERIPYKEKRLLVSEACLMYKRIQAQKRKLYSGDNKLSDVQKALNINNLKTLSFFDTVIELLDKQEAEVIKNDFINEEPQS